MSRLMKITLVAWGASLGAVAGGYAYFVVAPGFSTLFLDAVIAWTAVAVGAGFGLMGTARATQVPARNDPAEAGFDLPIARTMESAGV